jgi:hypothetical protein
MQLRKQMGADVDDCQPVSLPRKERRRFELASRFWKAVFQRQRSATLDGMTACRPGSVVTHAQVPYCFFINPAAARYAYHLNRFRDIPGQVPSMKL